MPVYACYRGDCDHLAYFGTNLVVLKDALGKDWLCVNTERSEIEVIPPEVTEMLRTQFKAHGLGISTSGSNISMTLADNVDDLARKLILNTYPPGNDSLMRLRDAFLFQSHYVEHSIPGGYRLRVVFPTEFVEVEGETYNEVCFRAAQSVFKENSIMTNPIQPDPVPLHTDESGTIRIGSTRITLDTLIAEYQVGTDPEGIVCAYPSLRLVDVYSVIAYYLRHKVEVDKYLDDRRVQADRIQQEIESRQPDRVTLRAKLMARRAEQEQEHASACN